MTPEELETAEDWQIIRHCGADARRWTDALYAKFPDAGERIDSDTMLGWFANAIEAACDVRHDQAQREAFEMACKAQCGYCRAGIYLDEFGNHLGKGAGLFPCKAFKIRALIDQETEPPATQASTDNPSGEGV